MHIALKDLPSSISNALHSLNYNRADIDVEVCDTVSPHYAADDGYRAVCMIVNIATGETKAEVGSWGGANPFECKGVDVVQKDYRIPEGCAIIKGMIGHKSFLHLYLSSANVVPAMLAPAPDLTREQARVLYAHKGLKSSARKGTYSLSDLPAMVQKGYIRQTKVGTSITTEGRNAFEVWCKANGKSVFNMP